MCGSLHVAYGNHIASVPYAEVGRHRRDASAVLRHSRLETVSHLLASWVKAEPIGGLLREALDGGDLLAEHLHHPLRPPRVHAPERVAPLAAALREAFAAATAGEPVREVRWFIPEIEWAIGLFEHAAARGEAVVSVLTPPLDEARASQVRIPFEVPQE